MRKQRLLRVARSNVLWGVTTFLVLQLGLAVAVDFWLPQIRDPAYVYRAHSLQRRTRATPGHPSTVVMLGSSHVQHGLKAKELEDQLAARLGRPAVVCNYGKAAGGPVANLFTLNRLLTDKIRPDLVLVEVAPSLMGGQNAEPVEMNNLSVSQLSLQELNRLEAYGVPVSRLRSEWCTSQVVPCYGHRAEIFTLLRGKLQEHLDDCGWHETGDPMVTAETRRQGISQARDEHYALLQDYRATGPAWQALADLLNLCRNQGIAAAMVWMPEGAEFRSWYPRATLNEVYAALDRLRREYAMPFINAREWVADEHFADGHHLLSAGAAAFTSRLGPEALKLLRSTERRDP